MGTIVVGSCAEWKAFWGEGTSDMSTSLLVRTGATLFSSTVDSLREGSPTSYSCGNLTVLAAVVDALQHRVPTSVLDCHHSKWRVAMCSDEPVICSTGADSEACSSDEIPCQSLAPGDQNAWMAPCVSGISHHTANSSYDRGALDVIGFGFIDPFPAPDILNTTVESTSRNEVVVSVLVNGSAPGVAGTSLHCGLFGNDEIAEIEVDVSATLSAIMAQRRTTWPHRNTSMSMTDVSGKFSFGNLMPATSYTVLCTTKSSLGSVLPEENIWTNSVTTRTKCCKEVVVRQFVHNATVGRISNDVLSVVVVDAPSVEPLLLRVSATVSASADVLSEEFFAPTETQLTRARFVSSKELEVMHRFYSGVEGTFHLDVVLEGEAMHEYSVRWLGDAASRTIDTTYSFVEPSVPLMESVIFSTDGATVTVFFSSPTDSGGQLLSSSFACMELFTFPGVATAWCRWSKDGRSVAIERAAYLVPGDVVTCRRGILRAKCFIDGNEDTLAKPCELWASMPVQSKTVSVPANADAPQFTINSSPKVLGADDLLTVDIASAMKSGGRPWRAATLTVQKQGNESTIEVPASVQEALYSESVAVMPKTLFEAGQSHVVSITLCNFLDMCATESAIVAKKQVYSIPVVRIVGSSVVLDIFAYQELLLKGDAFVYDAQGGQSLGGGMGYEWQVLINGVPNPTIKSTSKLPSVLRLPNYALKAGETYIVKLVAYRLASPDVRGFNEVTVHVRHAALVPVIFGGHERYLRPNDEDFLIDASLSYDMNDIPGSAPNPNLKYQWSCQLLKPYFSKDCAADNVRNGIKYKKASLQSAVLKVWFVATEEMSSANTTSEFTLRVYDAVTTREASAKVVVVAASLASPSVIVYVDGEGGSSRALAKGNVNRRMLLHGSGEHSTSGDLSWTVSPSLPASAFLTATTVRLIAGDGEGEDSGNLAGGLAPSSFDHQLLVAPGSLLERTTYTFQLTCRQVTGEQALASLSITTNGPPLPGKFDVTPKAGTEFETPFKLVVQNWADEDIPISYAFGYLAQASTSYATTERVMSVRMVSEVTSATSMFPAGSWNGTARVVACVATIFDSLGANSTAVESIVVDVMTADSELGRVEALESLANEQIASILQDTGDVSARLDEARELVMTLATALNTQATMAADCSQTSDAFCASRNRIPCTLGAVDQTCGPCVSDAYIGMEGASNEECFVFAVESARTAPPTRSPTFAPTARPSFTANPTPASTENSSSGGSGGGNPTKAPTALPSVTPTPAPTQSPTAVPTPETTLSPEIMRYLSQPKTCSGGCSGHGTCLGVSILDSSIIPVTNCTVLDATCETVCACEEGFSGASCDTSQEEMKERQGMREKLVVHLVNVSLYEDITEAVVSNRINSLVALSQVPEELNDNTKSVVLDMLEETADSIYASMDDESGRMGSGAPIPSVYFDTIFKVMDGLVGPTGQNALLSSTNRLRRLAARDAPDANATSNTFVTGAQSTLAKVKHVAAIATRVAAAESVEGEFRPKQRLFASIKTLSRAGLLEGQVEARVPQSTLDQLRRSQTSLAAVDALPVDVLTAGASEVKLSVMELDARLYDDSTDDVGTGSVSTGLLSQPLLIQLRHDPGICRRDSRAADLFNVRLTMRHRAPVSLPIVSVHEPSIVSCFPGEVNVTKPIAKPCSVSHRQSITCNGTGASYSIDCTSVKRTTCSLPPDAMLGLHAGQPLPASACALVSYSPMETVCECNMCEVAAFMQTRRRLQFSGKSDKEVEEGELELVAMSEYVLSDFVYVVRAIDRFDSDLVGKADIVVAFFTITFCVIVACIIIADLWHRKDEVDQRIKKENLQSHMSTLFLDTKSSTVDGEDVGASAPHSLTLMKGTASSSVAPVERFLVTSEDKQLGKMLQFVSSLFPGTFSNFGTEHRLKRELMNHQFVALMFSSTNIFDRVISALDVVSTVCVGSFLIAFLLDLQYPSDDGVCETYIDKDSCLADRSMFDSDASKCEWKTHSQDRTAPSCVWTEPRVTLFVMGSIIFIVIVVTGPFYTMLDIVFDVILRAPSPKTSRDATELNTHMKKFLKGMSNREVNNGLSKREVYLSRRKRRRGGLLQSSDFCGDDEVGDVEDRSHGDVLATKKDHSMDFTEEEKARTSIISVVHERAKNVIAISSSKPGLTLPSEFDVAYRIASEFAAEENFSTTQLRCALQRWNRRRHRLTTRRLSAEEDAEAEEVKPSSSLFRVMSMRSMSAAVSSVFGRDMTELKVALDPVESPDIYIVSAFTVLNVDLSEAVKFIDTKNLEDVIALYTHLQNLETELLAAQDSLKGDLRKLFSFNLQWGLQSSVITPEEKAVFREAEHGTTIRDRYFIGRAVGRAFGMGRKMAQELKGLPDFHVGIRLLLLHAVDLLGIDTPHAGTFRRKFSLDFSQKKALPFEIKVVVAVVMGLMNIFLVLMCLSYGATKGRQWQQIWLFATSLKVFFDVFVKRSMVSLVLGYSVPSIIAKDVFTIKSYLKQHGARLLRSPNPFRFKRFSASDYTFISSAVARQFPNLLESKLVMVYRCIYPEPLPQARDTRYSTQQRTNGAGMQLWQMFLFAILTLVLQFGSLDPNLQRLVLHTVPVFLMICTTYMLIFLGTSSTFLAFLALVLLYMYVPKLVTEVRSRWRWWKRGYWSAPVKKARHKIRPTNEKMVQEDAAVVDFKTAQDELHRDVMHFSAIEFSEDDDSSDDNTSVATDIMDIADMDSDADVADSDESHDKEGTSGDDESIDSAKGKTNGDGKTSNMAAPTELAHGAALPPVAKAISTTAAVLYARALKSEENARELMLATRDDHSVRLKQRLKARLEKRPRMVSFNRQGESVFVQPRIAGDVDGQGGDVPRRRSVRTKSQRPIAAPWPEPELGLLVDAQAQHLHSSFNSTSSASSEGDSDKGADQESLSSAGLGWSDSCSASDNSSTDGAVHGDLAVVARLSNDSLGPGVTPAATIKMKKGKKRRRKGRRKKEKRKNIQAKKNGALNNNVLVLPRYKQNRGDAMNKGKATVTKIARAGREKQNAPVSKFTKAKTLDSTMAVVPSSSKRGAKVRDVYDMSDDERSEGPSLSGDDSDESGDGTYDAGTAHMLSLGLHAIAKGGQIPLRRRTAHDSLSSDASD